MKKSMAHNKNSIFLLLIFAALSSCIGTKKIQQVSEKLNSLQSLQSIEKDKITNISTGGDSKLADGKIDSNINARLQQRLSVIKQQQDSIDKKITNIQSLVFNKKAFRNAYKNVVGPQLAELDSFYKSYEERMKIYLMLDDGLNTANYVLFDLAAFFGPGLYQVPSGQEQMAAQSFLPLVDSLVRFSNKYQQQPRTATLVILGYADGQNINSESALHDTLTSMIGVVDPGKEALNKKLSELRAVELIKQLKNLLKQKIAEIKNIDQFKVEYIGQGKGEEYPIPTIKDYKEDDERRRIVLCYWAVLPDL
jgi:hypothetical protein